MEKDLEYNPALFNSCGIINRRDFFLNTLYALMIISPLWITYSAIISMPKLVDGGMYDKFLIILLILSYIVFTLILLPSCIISMINIELISNVIKIYEFFIK